MSQSTRTQRGVRTLSISSTLTDNSLFRSPSRPPALDDLKLSHVLNGETCPPISFADFATFIASKEFSSENLLFLIWFRSYRERYEQLAADVRERVPVPSTKLGDRYSPFRYIDQATQNGVVTESATTSQRPATSAHLQVNTPVSHPRGMSRQEERRGSTISSHGFEPCAWTAEGKPCSCANAKLAHAHDGPSKWTRARRRSVQHEEPPAAALRPILTHTSLYPTLPPAGTTFLPTAELPMRDEAMRAYATFLKKGGSKELGIADELRQFAKLTLGRSTAPEAFLPIYEEVYSVVENQSLPHFLSYARTNINRPKQLFWYIVGTCDMLIGLIIYLVITLLVTNHRYALRATRLPSAVFVCFGAMQTYSAWRGFCQQVYGRNSRQVRPWEMDAYEDEEAAIRSEIAPSDEIVTPVATPGEAVPTDEFKLPDEVHPLSVMGDVPALSWAPEYLFPAKTEEDQPAPRLSSELSDVELRQLAIRRATVKVPDASLAFPVEQPMETFVTPPTPEALASPTVLDKRSKREISPWSGSSPPTADAAGVPTSPANDMDISALLGRFSSRLGRAEAVEHSTKVFGPEKLVEDPRIQKLYQDIVRDILIVGGLAAGIWIALCFAVPMAGLV